MRFVGLNCTLVVLMSAVAASAAEFSLITGVDPLMNPGTTRMVFPFPGPGFPAEFRDGDRLAGTSDAGGVAEFEGEGTPMFDPNEFGALSFTFRRGSIPVPPNNQVPILAIDFLGGPRLDLDGDLDNGVRSLIPVFDVDPVVMPDTRSSVGLSFDFDASTVTLEAFDMTSTNPGGPGIQAEISTTVNVLAGTANDGTPGEAINPSVDTREGDLIAFTGLSGGLGGVYAIEDLGFELWQDSIDPASSSASVLGTLQLLGAFRGWLVIRDPQTGAFPTLAGQELGSSLWPTVNIDHVGETYATANGLQGGSATITNGPATDPFDVCGVPPGNCNGGEAYVDNGGDLGAYFDQVVVPALAPDANSFVYLESAGFGINNSFDPVFGDTSGWDVVIVAGSPCGILPEPPPFDLNGDLRVDLDDYDAFNDCVSGPGGGVAEGCEGADGDHDDDIDLLDFAGFQGGFGTELIAPPCALQE